MLVVGLIAPWPFGRGIQISLLQFYFDFIVGIFSGLGLLMGSMFTAMNWQTLSMMIALIAYPVGLYFAYKSTRYRRPSIYQGAGTILAAILWMAAVFVTIPNFTEALGPYIAIIGGLILELAYFLHRPKRSSHYRRRRRR